MPGTSQTSVCRRFVAEAKALGLNTVSFAGSYHAGKFIRPHGGTGKVYFPEDGTAYFRIDPQRYGKIKPLENSLLGQQDTLKTLCESDIAVNAWMVLLHNTRLGTLHPEASVENAFGDRYLYSLCPSAPEAREYAVALCKDVTESYPVIGVSLETPGFLPYQHGFHHEFALLKQNKWLDAQLGLCFCPHCLQGASANGIDAAGLKRRVANAVEAYLGGELDIPDDMAEAFWLADALDGELGAYLRYRCEAVTSLVAEIRASVRKDATVAVIPSVARPTAGAWYEGSDLAALAKTADAIEACFYEPSVERVRVDAFDVLRRVGDASKLRGILRPAWPDLESKSKLVGAVSGAPRCWHRRHRLLQLRSCATRQSRMDRRRIGHRRLMVQFGGKVFVITGSAGGIGRELCRHFGGEGAAIIALDRSETVTDFAEELRAAGIRVEAAVVDIGDSEAVAEAFARLQASLGAVDVLVNNAGVSSHPSLEKTTPHDFADDVNANVNGAYNCCYAVLPGMKKKKAGAIVNIASVNGLAALGDPAYSAGKAGMISLTRSLAVEFGRYGIRANAVCPGTVRTPIWAHRIALNPEVLEQLARWYPLGRIVEPVEVVHAVAFLASDAASAITGTALPVDCGLMAGNIVMTRELTPDDT